MKFKHTLIISALVLAVAGGLAGCGNKPSTHHASKPRTSKQSQKQMKQRKIAREQLKSINVVKRAVKNVPKRYSKYVRPDDSRLTTGLMVIGVTSKSKVGDNSPVASNPEAVAKGYWHSIRNSIIKQGGTEKYPVQFIFTYRKAKAGNMTTTHSESLMFSGLTNSSKLSAKDQGKLITSDDGSSAD